MFLLGKLNVGEETWRHLLFQATGVHSRAELSETQQDVFIAELEKHVAKEFKSRPRGPRPSGGKVQRMATPAQKELITQIFTRQMSWTTDRLEGFILRMTHRRTCELNGLKIWEAANMIEAGKQMQKRDATNPR